MYDLYYDETESGSNIMERIYYLILVVFILTLIFYLKKKYSFKQEHLRQYDLIIIFDAKHYCDIRYIPEFMNLATWIKYSRYTFRGLSKISKEELEQFVEEKTNLTDKDFKVLNGSVG